MKGLKTDKYQNNAKNSFLSFLVVLSADGEAPPPPFAHMQDEYLQVEKFSFFFQ